MMRLTKRLFGLPVQTRAGIGLGSLWDFEIETDTGRIQKLCVKSGGLVKGLMKDELLIDWSRVVEIQEHAVIVEDVMAKETGQSLAQSVAPSTMAMASDLLDTE